MQSDLGGITPQLYAKYRRDLPAARTAAIAGQIGLRPDDVVVVDLGCGTGQLAVPLLPHCAAILGVDPEPSMLVELHARRAPQVWCLLGDESDLPQIRAVCDRPIGAVVIGNALQWMDEAATFRAAAALLRPGGAVAVITQGQTMWLGTAPWHVGVRATLEATSRPFSGNCRTDQSAFDKRAEIARGLGLDVHEVSWQAEHVVTVDWVVGHMGSAMNADRWSSTAADMRSALQAFAGQPMVERVSTTAFLAFRSS